MARFKCKQTIQRKKAGQNEPINRRNPSVQLFLFFLTYQKKNCLRKWEMDFNRYNTNLGNFIE